MTQVHAHQPISVPVNALDKNFLQIMLLKGSSYNACVKQENCTKFSYCGNEWLGSINTIESESQYNEIICDK